MTIWPRVLLLILAFLCASCTAPVAFVSPCAPGPDPNNNSCQPSSPVTQTKMAFDSNFSPSNSLSVTFNGQDITSALSPPPAPNGTSTAGLPRPPNPSYYTTATQTLQANATCGFFCVYPTKTVTFTPPGIAISAAGQNFPNIPVSASLSAPSKAFVVTPAIQNVSVAVTLTANLPAVRFMSSPQGPASTSLTVNVSGEAIFYLKAVQGSPGQQFTVSGVAPGLLRGSQSGAIAP
jgi:hypothetical protein